MKKIKKTTILIASSFFLLRTAVGRAKADWDNGWDMPDTPAGVNDDLEASVENLTNWLLGIIGMVAVVAIIWGGFQYLTSAGNQDQARNAKETIKWALIGLFIAGVAYAFVNVLVTTIL